MTKKAKPHVGGSEVNGVLPRLKAIYEFMTQHDLESLELDESDTHLRMVRRKAASSMPVPVPLPQAGLPQGAPASPTAAPARPASNEALPPGSIAIKSNMMGIFYRAPSPSSPPFVKEGDMVKIGQVLCMIEAMKVFNEIKAEFPCTVLKVLLENGKPVKSGQELFVVSRA
ncbi:MAG: acetyl-CoA carboxylase biotin carboxyl carrier protein [Elusimicrobia bacterium]|nr:acetyl-CoA carboxylase biotin carboxyl carrier protein [Elusimicrobiota bacterium]